MSEVVEEYQPGLTELRLNAKSNLTNLQKVFERLEMIMKEFQDLKDQVTDIQRDNVALGTQVRTLQAKLYESGIR